MSVKCPNCGSVLPDGTLFCDVCGTAVNTGTIFKDEKNVYRWVYELPMMKTFILLFEVWKVLGIAAGAVMVLVVAAGLLSGAGFSSALGSCGVVLLVTAILFALSLPAYYIVTKANNGMYTVLFEMDENGIDHIQIKTEKAKALEVLTMFAGSAAHNNTVLGAGALAAAGGSLHSTFANVKYIKAVPAENLIRVNGTLIHNQVYTDAENFDFVYDFIVSHCPDADIG